MRQSIIMRTEIGNLLWNKSNIWFLDNIQRILKQLLAGAKFYSAFGILVAAQAALHIMDSNTHSMGWLITICSKCMYAHFRSYLCMFLAFGIQHTVFGIRHVGIFLCWLYGPPSVFTFLNYFVAYLTQFNAFGDYLCCCYCVFAVFIIVEWSDLHKAFCCISSADSCAWQVTKWNAELTFSIICHAWWMVSVNLMDSCDL